MSMRSIRQHRKALSISIGVRSQEIESPEALLLREDGAPVKLNLIPMSEIDEMIARGWGDVPRAKLPANWREKIGPDYRVRGRK